MIDAEGIKDRGRGMGLKPRRETGAVIRTVHKEWHYVAAEDVYEGAIIPELGKVREVETVGDKTFIFGPHKFNTYGKNDDVFVYQERRKKNEGSSGDGKTGPGA